MFAALNSAQNNVRRAINGFHNDEDGMEALQVVMIVAIGAVVLLLLKTMWPAVKSYVNSTVQKITSWTT